jgi:glycogen(starch) synthase
MLGWEFPPFISGGLGTACYGLTKALNQLNIKVTFVLPKKVNTKYATHVNLLTPGSIDQVASFACEELKNVKFLSISSSLKPYSRPGVSQTRVEETLKEKMLKNGFDLTEQAGGGMDYCGDMYTEIHRYAAIAAKLAEKEQFDVVHAHDWMTYPAGMAVAKMSGKPTKRQPNDL